MIFMEGWQWANEQVKFWWRSGSPSGYRDCFPDSSLFGDIRKVVNGHSFILIRQVAALVRRAFAAVCIVAVYTCTRSSILDPPPTSLKNKRIPARFAPMRAAPLPYLSLLLIDTNSLIQTRNRKRRQAAAKPAACAKPLMLATLGSKGKRDGG